MNCTLTHYEVEWIQVSVTYYMAELSLNSGPYVYSWLTIDLPLFFFFFNFVLINCRSTTFI